MREQIKTIKTQKDLKIQIPSLMKEGFDLFDFQHRAVAMMYIVPRMVLGYDVGLGKSAITITTYALLKEKGKAPKTLYVVTPRSALYQWQSEVEKFSHLSSFVIDAAFMDKEERAHYYKNVWGQHDVVISTYSLMYRDLLYLERHLRNTMAALDEVVKLKNKDAKLYKTAGRLFSSLCPRLYGLSASVLKKDLIEPFNIFNIIEPGCMPSYSKFLETYCITEKKRIGHRVIKNVVGHTNIESFYNLFEPYYIGCKKTDIDTKNLPKVVLKPVFTNMEGNQKKFYTQVLNDFLELDLEVEDTSAIFKKLIRCQQISDSPSILELKASSNKEKALVELVEEEIPQDQKVVIFTKFKKGVYRLKELLSKYDPLSITGDDKGVSRDQIKRDFTDNPERRIIIINTAAREAINLQVSGNLIFFNLDWSYGDNLQIIGRINRLGSEHEVNNVYMLMNKGSIDEYVYHSVVKGEGYFEKLLGGVGYELGSLGLKNFAKSFSAFNKKFLKG